MGSVAQPEFGDTGATVARVEGHTEDRELLAEYRQRLRLVRVPKSGGSPDIVIEVLNDDGCLAGATSYVHEEFPLAASDYSRRIAESLDSVVVRVSTQAMADVASFDHKAVAAALHDDFVQLDFRQLGYPDLDRAGFLEALDAQSDIIRVWLTQAIHAAGRDVHVGAGSLWTLHYGQWTPLTQGIFVNVSKGGQWARLEIYPDEQLDVALRRFSELTA